MHASHAAHDSLCMLHTQRMTVSPCVCSIQSSALHTAPATVPYLRQQRRPRRVGAPSGRSHAALLRRAWRLCASSVACCLTHAHSMEGEHQQILRHCYAALRLTLACQLHGWLRRACTATYTLQVLPLPYPHPDRSLTHSLTAY